MLQIKGFDYVCSGWDCVYYRGSIDTAESVIITSKLNVVRTAWLELVAPWWRPYKVGLDEFVGYVVPTMQDVELDEVEKDPICAVFVAAYKMNWDYSLNQLLHFTEQEQPTVYDLLKKYTHQLSNLLPQEHLWNVRLDAHKGNFLKHKGKIVPWDMWVSDHRPWQKWE